MCPINDYIKKTGTITTSKAMLAQKEKFSPLRIFKQCITVWNNPIGLMLKKKNNLLMYYEDN